MKKGAAGDLQKHRLKDETGYIIFGTLEVTYADKGGKLTSRILKDGDTYHFPPGCIHKSVALSETTILEASNPVFNDRIRMEEYFGIPNDESGLPTTGLNDITFSP